MSGVQAYAVDGVYVRIRPTRNSLTKKYLALAKREPFQLPGADPISEPGEVWFKFGDDVADLVDLLVAEVQSAPRPGSRDQADQVQGEGE